MYIEREREREKFKAREREREPGSRILYFLKPMYGLLGEAKEKTVAVVQA